MTILTFPSIITDKGMIRLENYFEEYRTSSVLSPEKLARFQTLLFTYYMQTGNLIHKDVFEEVKRKLENLSNGGSSFVSKSIEFLFKSGCIERNPEFISRRQEK